MPKVYTKRGDQGKSDLYYTKDLPKSEAVFEALGNIDELNCFVGLLESEIHELDTFMLDLPHVLFDLGAMIAMENVSEIDEQYIQELIIKCEQSIDQMAIQLKPLKVFILPGGTKSVSLTHICRAIARRAERSVWNLNEKYVLIGQFLNRLSDYFFMLSRFICLQEGKSEIRWHKREER
jgi:cob(I)alamin adenosyltransferase